MTEETLQESGNQQLLKNKSLFYPTPEKDFDEIAFLTQQICSCSAAVLSIYEGEEHQVLSVSGISAESVPPSGRLLNILEMERKILYKMDFENGYFAVPPELGDFSFYAGIPLLTAENKVLGILYVLDYQKEELTEEQEIALTILGNQLIKLINYGKQHTELKNVQLKLRQKYRDLEKFASVVSHDIKSPLANIISLTEFLKEENKGAFNEETRQYLDFLIQSSYSLRNYVDGILTFYRSDNILEKEKEDVDLYQLLRGIAYLFQVNSRVEIIFPTSGILKNVNKAALTQIFLNLIGNALKYNDKEAREVNIIFEESVDYYFFQVKDNGNGIPEGDFDKIFDLFTTLDQNDRDGHPGSGIGLATVKKMLDHMQGAIELESKLGKGSNFKFRIKRK